MTVKFVTHSLNTDTVTLVGHVNDVTAVRGTKISRIGAVEGKEKENPAAIHVNFQVVDQPDDLLVMMIGLSDAVEVGLQLVAMGIDAQPSDKLDGIRDRLSELVNELDKSLQVSH